MIAGEVNRDAHVRDRCGRDARTSSEAVADHVDDGVFGLLGDVLGVGETARPATGSYRKRRTVVDPGVPIDRAHAIVQCGFVGGAEAADFEQDSNGHARPHACAGRVE